MAPGIKCRSCKHWNRVGSLYCHACGEKLVQRIAQRGGGFILSFIRSLTRLVLGLIFVAALGLMLWPVMPTGKMGDPEDRELFLERMYALSDAVRLEERMIQPISEEEFNSFLAYLVALQAGGEKHTFLDAGIAGINVTFTPNSLVALIVGAYGPLYLTYEIHGVPSAGEDGFLFDVGDVRLGHMPMPDLMADVIVGRAVRMFSSMQQERAVLDSISKFQLGDGRIVAGVEEVWP